MQTLAVPFIVVTDLLVYNERLQVSYIWFSLFLVGKQIIIVLIANYVAISFVKSQCYICKYKSTVVLSFIM